MFLNYFSGLTDCCGCSHLKLRNNLKIAMVDNRFSKEGCRHTWGLGNQLFLFGGGDLGEEGNLF